MLWQATGDCHRKGNLMKLETRFFKVASAISVLVLAALLISACGNAALAARVNDGSLTICHATGDAGTPYEALTLNFDGLTAHADHEADFIPNSAEDCAKTVTTGENTNTGKITICHATGTTNNPYDEITIDFNGLRGHSNHADDVIPVPEGGCPQVTVTPINTATATVTGTLTVTPTPTTTPTPQTVNARKITICHATGSAKNPYVFITVSVNGLNGHNGHSGDIIPAPAEGCPSQ
jgi:hypothetical protein